MLAPRQEITRFLTPRARLQAPSRRSCSPAATGPECLRPRQTGLRRLGTDGSQTPRRRRQSAANSSRKWSSESQVFGVPTGKWAFSPGDRPIYAIVITLIFRMQVLPRRLIFPSIKERGGSTRSKFVQNVRLFSQLRFKTHNIGSFGHVYQSGILWS